MTALYDSTDPTKIPANAPMVAGYTSGLWPTFGRLAGLFPNAIRISIAIDATHDADVLDVEQGDATPADVVAWVNRQRSHGADPTVYCSRVSMWPAVQAAVATARIAPPHYWIADYTGVKHLVPGSSVTQWADIGPYDISETNGSWHQTPAPGPTPSPTPTPVTTRQEQNMIAATPSGNGDWLLHADGSVWSMGDAQYFGGCNVGASAPFPAGVTAVSIAAHPGGQGYWIYSSAHGVYAFGAAGFHGNA